MATTIQVSSKTRGKLAALKNRPRESYDAVVNRLLSLIPEGDDEGRYSNAFRTGLVEARLDIRAGRLVDLKNLKRQLGL